MVETIDALPETVILTPFDGSSPAGEDLRFDVSPQSIYFRLRDARSEARAAERLADNDPTLGGAMPAQWNTVHDLAVEALSSRSKDVEVACWLTEALTRKFGLAGLADGTATVAGLIARFWDAGLFPSAEEGEDRLIAITGMSGQDRDGSLLQPLRKLVLFNRPDGTPVTLWDYERAREFAALGAKSDEGQRANANIMSFSEIDGEAQGPGRPHLVAFGNDVSRARGQWLSLEETITRVTPAEWSPSTGRVSALLEDLRKLVGRYVSAGEQVASEDERVSAHAVASDEEPATTKDTRGRPQAEGRDAMLDELARIAAVFRRTEPNSPLSFTLEDAVRRARLPWPDLMRELIPDVSAHSTLLAVAGIRPPSE